MPQFTAEESLEIQGSSDFFGLNFYTANLAYPTPSAEIDPSIMSWTTDSDVTDFKDPNWYGGASTWLKGMIFIEPMKGNTFHLQSFETNANVLQHR